MPETNENPAPEDYNWAIREMVQITIIEQGLHDRTAYLVERSDPAYYLPGSSKRVSNAVVLAVTESGTLSINGQYIDVGDDYIQYINMLDASEYVTQYPAVGTCWTTEPTEYGYDDMGGYLRGGKA